MKDRKLRSTNHLRKRLPGATGSHQLTISGASKPPCDYRMTEEDESSARKRERRWRSINPSHLTMNLWEGLPTEPRAQLAAIRQIYASLRNGLRPMLEKTIAALLKEGTELGANQKAEIVHDVNQVLADSRLAIQNHLSDTRATLILSRREKSDEVGYLRLHDSHRRADGRRAVSNVQDIAASGNFRLVDTTATAPKKI